MYFMYFTIIITCPRFLDNRQYEVKIEAVSFYVGCRHLFEICVIFLGEIVFKKLKKQVTFYHIIILRSVDAVILIVG